MQSVWKNRNSNEQYCLHIKTENLPKKPSATKHIPLSNVYFMEIYRKVLFEYNLMGILKPQFTRRNSKQSNQTFFTVVQWTKHNN